MHNTVHQFERTPHGYYLHDIFKIPPHLDDVLHHYPRLHQNLNVKAHGFCFHEGAPQSITGLNEWFAYLRLHHLPIEYHDIHKIKTTFTFGGKVKQNVEAKTIGRVHIRVPIPGQLHFDYESIMILNDIPILFGLATQIRLQNVTYKNHTSPRDHSRFRNVTLPLVHKFEHTYYSGDLDTDFLFYSAKLAQIHGNIGHAPPGYVYSALRSTYTI